MLTGCGSSDHDSNTTTTSQSRPQLQSFDTCADLQTYLLDTARKQRTILDSGYGLESGSDEFSPLPVADGDTDTPVIADRTGTNNQVAGVDEADFVKSSGEFTYLLSGDYFLILRSWPAAQSEELSRTQLEGVPRALFVDDDIVWVVSDVLTSQPDAFAARSGHLLKISIYRVSDPQSPQLIRETRLEAYYSDARLIDHRVHLVTSAYLDLYPYLDDPQGIELGQLLPAMADSTNPSEPTATTTRLISECDGIYRTDTANGSGTLSIISFDLQNPLGEIGSESILSNTGTVYATPEFLYVATIEDETWLWLPVMDGEEYPSPGTNIHKFRVGQDPEYLASGRVDGWLINAFAMDEYQGVLRLVTTEENWWRGTAPANRLFVLEQNGDTLVERSRLEGLGKPGDRIFAARFLEDKGFLVTYRQIDPFYTPDLSNPDQPRKAGELEVPGVSTYLHPVDDNMILAVGRDTDTNGLMISLFDIAQFDHPMLLSSHPVGADSYSQAEYNHHAFTWFQAGEMLALPVTRWNYAATDDPFTAADLFTGLELFRVNRADGIQFSSSLDHDRFYQEEGSDLWYYPEGVQRSFFISDDQGSQYLYSISSRGMLVNDLAAPETPLAAIPLPAPVNDYFYFD
ncbi:MAG: beta-propeller domain-containing protein [Candidatus Thiodiazotropha sp.]